MARKSISQYVFTPGTSGLGTIKVPERINLEDFLAVYDTTNNVSIYNFGSPTQGGTVAWAAGVTADFPTAYDGVTTLTLDLDTSTLSSSDKLSIYVEDQYLSVIPWAFGQDAIGRERVSNPQSLIDADFEYGLQNTKWQNFATTNNIPNFYDAIGTDIAFNTNGYVSMIAGDDVITSNVDTSIRIENQGTPAWVDADYGLVISQTQGNTTPFTQTHLTANVNSSAERTFTVASTTGYTAGDNILIIGRPTSGGTAIAANITSTATTSVVCANVAAAGIADGSYVITLTDTANVYETMAVTNVTANTLTVVRQTNNTNSGAANITLGNDIYAVSTIEVAQIYAVTDATTLQLTRGWYNTQAANTFATGTVIQKLSSNVEIVNMSTTSTAVNGAQTITRGQFSTTALTAAATGSPVVRLTGAFYSSGDANLPQVTVNATAHGLTAGEYVSTNNMTNSNTEGVNFVASTNTNNFTYYPKRSPSLAAGYPLNQTDSAFRQAFAFSGADIDIQSIVSDGATPSTITVTTNYAHGLVPGTPILVSLTTGTNQAYAEGSFFIVSVPSTTTFTYTAKSGAAVSGSLAGTINVRSNSAFLPRSFDGGVIMSAGSPTRGASAVRQTKKYFRYQSGKGISFTSGTMLQPTFDVVNVASSGTAVNSNISITTDIEHGLNPGATITLAGITTSGYNGTGYIVTSITSDITFVVQAQVELGGVTGELGTQPRISVTAWHGASVRAGIFDDQNGLFWEHDGVSLNIVQRSSTFQLAGFASVGVGSNLVTGDGTCRFQEQLNQGDQIVIRGMTHTVTSITDNNRMSVVPPFRGVSNQNRIKLALRFETRVKQSQFNIDTLDGAGASGFTIDPSKMQMLLVEYSWYGAGYVQWGVRAQGGIFAMAHKIPNNNRNNEAYMRSGNLPARYEAINETPISSLSAAINSSETTIPLVDASSYPPASVTYPVFVMIESEIIKYSGKAGNSLTGCTRAATFVQWAEGQSRSYTSSASASHAINTGVILISNTCVPVVNHWGSAIIMDGNFDEDTGYQFTFNRTNYGMPVTTGLKQVPFCMRLSPSVSNGIVGDLGDRDLINRAQLGLSQLTINLPTTGSRFLLEGILNPSNIDSANTVWTGLNNSAGGFQPSFTQFSVAPRYTSETTGGLVGSQLGTTGGMAKSGTKASLASSTTYSGISPVTVTGSGSGGVINVSLRSSGSTTYSDTNTSIVVTTSGTGYAIGDTIKVLGNVIGASTTANDLTLTIRAITNELQGGERLFAIPVTTTNSGQLDLTTIKQIGTSGIPGTGTYPNGPEVIALQVTAITSTAGAVADIQLQFSESQA
jgi:hypothetical protein